MQVINASLDRKRDEIVRMVKMTTFVFADGATVSTRWEYDGPDRREVICAVSAVPYQRREITDAEWHQVVATFQALPFRSIDEMLRAGYNEQNLYKL